jgi:adenylylsulfate kinase-like enzyme
VLDCDLVREDLSAELSSSREQRDANIRRIRDEAFEITRKGDVALWESTAARLIQSSHHGRYLDLRQLRSACHVA